MISRSYRRIFQPVCLLLRHMGANGLADGIMELASALHARVRDSRESPFAGYGELYHSLIAEVAEKGCLSDAGYKKMRKQKRAIQRDLDRELNVDMPSQPWDRDVLLALHHMGGLNIVGDDCGFGFFVFPECLLLAIRLLSLLGSKDMRRHIHEVASIRRATLSFQQVENLESDFLTPVVQALRKSLERSLVREYGNLKISTADLDFVRVEYLPTATDFYFSGIHYYRNPSWRRQNYYVFSTTSGVVLPDERWGSLFWNKQIPNATLLEESHKNPFRSKYFQTLAGASKLARYYFFEWEGTARAFQHAIRRIRETSSNPDRDVGRYRQLSVQTTCDFLRKRRFGLTGVAVFPKEYRFFTLGNGRAALISGRDSNRSDSIGHGFMLHMKDDLARGLDLNMLSKWLKGIISKTTTHGCPYFFSGFVNCIVSVAFCGMKNLSARARSARVIDFGERVHQAIMDGNIVFDRFSTPDGRRVGVKRDAEDIVEKLEHWPQH